MKYLEVGKIIATFGIKGEVKVSITTDNIKRFDKNNILYVGNDINNLEEIKIDSFRVHKGLGLLSFNNIKDINNVLKYIEMYIYVDIEKNRKENEIYIDDIIGCNCIVNDNVIGKVKDVLIVPQGTILELLVNDEIKLVPNRKEFVKKIDITNKTIVIEPIEGLL